MSDIRLIRALHTRSMIRITCLISASLLLISFLKQITFEPPGPFSFIVQFPFVFWAGLAALILTTALWAFGSDDVTLGYSLVVMWEFYLFIGPVLMQPNAAGRDLWGHWFEAVNYPDSFLPHNIFLNEVAVSPGYYLFALILYKITGLGYQAFPKYLLETSLPFAFVIESLYLGKRVFKDFRLAILFVLLLEAFMWVPTNTLPSPELFGYLLTLFMLGLCIGGLGRNKLIFWLGLAGLVITHVLFSFIFVGYLLVLYVVDRFGISGSTIPRVSPGVLLGSILIYLAYYTLFPILLGAAIPSILAAFSNPQGGTPIYIPLTSYQEPTITMSWIFVGMVATWFLSAVIVKNKKLITDRKFLALLALLAPLSLIPLTGAYSQQGLLQIFFVGSPLLALVLIASRHRRIALTVFFILMLLPFSIVLRYSNHYVEPVPQSEFAGDGYLAVYNTNVYSVYWPVSGWTGQYANSVSLAKELTQVNYAEGGIKSTVPVQMVIMTAVGANILKWYEGDSVLDNVTQELGKVPGMVIYSNGGFVVYVYSRPVTLNYT